MVRPGFSSSPLIVVEASEDGLALDLLGVGNAITFGSSFRPQSHALALFVLAENLVRAVQVTY